jgi:hypothetical protein
MGRSNSMPPRGDRPGFKRGRHKLPYWIAHQVVRDAMGFPDKCIPLPADADDKTINGLCRDHTARLMAWIDEQKVGEGPASPRYDGTVLSACQVYQKHPFSRFHTVKANTRKSYVDSLKVIEGTVGKRLIRNLTVLDVQHWYNQWRKPVIREDAQGNTIAGAERIDRAHDAVSMFKTVLRLNAALRREDCGQLLADLKNASSMVTFERGGAREQEMTYAHASAFIRTARDLGSRGVIPADRGLYMAIGVAAQFELLLRQKDIIGERPKTVADLEKAVRRGATAIPAGPATWTGYFTWEKIAGWRWIMRTSKSKYRSAADFNLANYGMLFPLLEAVPHHERQGAIVKGEHGLPVQERSYRKWYRQIARAAGIPDEVWSMDSRAGGATEAEEAGAGLEAVQDAMTHSKQGTTLRYIRRRSANLATVADARNRKRAAEEGNL